MAGPPGRNKRAREIKSISRKEKKVAIISLGCPKNLVDSERFLAALISSGVKFTSSYVGADALLINTCCFIDDAKEESLDVILQAARLKATGELGSLIVVGCLGKRFGESLKREIPEIDLVMGLLKSELVPEIKQFLHNHKKKGSARPDVRKIEASAGFLPEVPRLRLTPRHFAYLRIAEGCSNRCSYCIIPELRGVLTSKPLEHILAEAEELASDGAREICLVGEDITSYGRDISENLTLARLLRELVKIPEVHWLRLLYTHPAHWTDALIRTVAEEDKVCKYVDLPIQHINDRILKAMGRKVSAGDIRSLMHSLRSRISGLYLRTSIIVGFPGETEVEFQELLEFVSEVGFERLGAFTYSKEEGTEAARMSGQIPEKIKGERLHRLMELQKEIAAAKNRQMIGKELEVLVDGLAEAGSGLYEARSYGDAPEVDGLVILSGDDLRIGNFYRARVTGFQEYDLCAEVVGAIK